MTWISRKQAEASRTPCNACQRFNAEPYVVQGHLHTADGGVTSETRLTVDRVTDVTHRCEACDRRITIRHIPADFVQQ